MDGYYSNINGGEILYNPDNEDTINREGLICALNEDVYTESLQLIKEAEKATFSESLIR